MRIRLKAKKRETWLILWTVSFHPRQIEWEKNISRYSLFKVRLGYGFLRSESFDYLFLVELYSTVLAWASNSGILVDRNMRKMKYNGSRKSDANLLPISLPAIFANTKAKILFIKNVRILLYEKKCKVGIACLNLFSEAKLTI